MIRSLRIILLLSLVVPGQFGHTQSYLPNSQPNAIPLADFLHHLEEEFQLVFNYESALVDTFHIEPLDRNKNIEHALAHLRASTPFEFVERQPHIIIKPKNPLKENVNPLVRGFIVDEQTGDPLPYATLIFQGTQRGTQADENGRFVLEVQPSDSKRSLEVHFLGYQTKLVEWIEWKKNKSISIKLNTSDLVIEDVLVREQAILPVEFRADEGFYDIRSDQLQLQAGWGEPDVLRMLQVVPGIQASDESSANLHIRGGTPDQNLLLLDDIPVYKPGHFFGFFSTINANLIDQIRVYKGGFGAAYGGRASGVIDIKNRLGEIEQFQGSVGLTPLNFHADIATPLFKKRSALLVGARGSVLDGRHPPLFKSTLNQKFQSGKIAEYRNFDDQELLNKNDVHYVYQDLNFRWQYRYKKDDEITISHFTNTDDFRYDFELDQPSFTQITSDNIESSNRGSAIKATNRWTPWWQSALNIVDSKFDNFYSISFTSDASQPFQIKAFQNNILEHNRIGLNQKFHFNNTHQLVFGLEANRWNISFATAYERIWIPETDTLSLELSNMVTTTFLDYQYQYNNELFIQVGIRRNRLNGSKKKKYEPRLSIKYKVSESPWLMKASVGTYQQFISQIVLDQNEDNLGAANGIWLTTELEVVPVVQSQDLILGLTYQKQGWTVDLEGYRKKTIGLSALNLRIDRSEQEVSPGESEASGLELIVQKKFGKYRSLLSYNLASVVYQFPDFNQRAFFPAPHDRRHYLQWNHMYAIGPFDFVLAWHFGSGLPYSVPANILQTQTAEDEVYHELLFDKRNTERLEAYHRLDFSVHYRWQGKKIGAKGGFSLFNVYGRENVIDRKYKIWYPSEDKLEPELTFSDRLGLRFTPSFYATLLF